jgi:hypothetical protein
MDSCFGAEAAHLLIVADKTSPHHHLFIDANVKGV